LRDLVEFLTGRGSCPRKILVKFTEIKQLPDPDTCFDCVTLSTSTKDFKEFCKEFDCVVSIECKGVGEVRSSPWLNDSSDLDNCNSFAICKKKITVETIIVLSSLSQCIFFLFFDLLMLVHSNMQDLAEQICYITRTVRTKLKTSFHCLVYLIPISLYFGISIDVFYLASMFLLMF